MEVLAWCREQEPPCPWNEETCAGKKHVSVGVGVVGEEECSDCWR